MSLITEYQNQLAVAQKNLEIATHVQHRIDSALTSVEEALAKQFKLEVKTWSVGKTGAGARSNDWEPDTKGRITLHVAPTNKSFKYPKTEKGRKKKAAKMVEVMIASTGYLYSARVN